MIIKSIAANEMNHCVCQGWGLSGHVGADICHNGTNDDTQKLNRDLIDT
jgi:hypothetical protein